MTSKYSEPPGNASSRVLPNIVAAALADLREANEAAYFILLARAESGFFAEHQTPRSVNALAAELLGTVSCEGAADAD